MDAKLITKHPDKTKKGVRIDKARYEAVRAAILAALRERREVTFTELSQAVERKLRGKFDGSVMWYVTTVKLDLEARKIIQRVPKSSPQQLRLA